MTREDGITTWKAIWRILITTAAIAGCDKATAPDTTPPTVASISPANSSVGVLINSVITITFSEPMKQSSINATSVTVAPTSAGTAVSGTVSYDATSHTATFTPSAALDYDKSYTILVTTAVMDLAGNPITTDYRATFQSIQKIFGTPYFQGTNNITDASQPQIHVHLRFTQSGQTIGHPADCERLPAANCDLLPRNAAGAAAIGTLDDQGIAATITQIAGTFSDPTIAFTFTLANGRTFAFSGNVTSSSTMTGTLSGATLPAIQIVLSREPEL